MAGSPRPLPELVLHLLDAVPLPPLNGGPLLFRVGTTRLQTCWQAAASTASGCSPSAGGASGGGCSPAAVRLESARLEFGGASPPQPEQAGKGSGCGTACQMDAQPAAALDGSSDAEPVGRPEQSGALEMTCAVEELSLAPLVEALSVDNLITLWLALLMERRWANLHDV